MKPPDVLISVVWEDAHGNAMGSYEAHEIPHQAALVCTHGMLFRDDENGISIIHESFAGGSIRGVTFVPRAMIRDTYRFERVKPKRRRKTHESQTAGREVVSSDRSGDDE